MDSSEWLSLSGIGAHPRSAHGVQRDNAPGRHQFERRMETLRLFETDEEDDWYSAPLRVRSELIRHSRSQIKQRCPKPPGFAFAD